MQRAIGEAAGPMGQYRSAHGTTTVRQLQRETALADCLLHLGAGWLAHADTLCVRQAHGILPRACTTVRSSRTERRTAQPRPRETTPPLRRSHTLGGRARDALRPTHALNMPEGSSSAQTIAAWCRAGRCESHTRAALRKALEIRDAAPRPSMAH